MGQPERRLAEETARVYGHVAAPRPRLGLAGAAVLLKLESALDAEHVALQRDGVAERLKVEAVAVCAIAVAEISLLELGDQQSARHGDELVHGLDRQAEPRPLVTQD